MRVSAISSIYVSTYAIQPIRKIEKRTPTVKEIEEAIKKKTEEFYKPLHLPKYYLKDEQGSNIDYYA